MKLERWAKCWNISAEALADLRAEFGIYDDIPIDTHAAELSEAAILNRVRAEASALGCRLWRNNVGATYTSSGDFIRYGLANDSAGVNRILKSADLIGIKPVLITQNMVGSKIGQFLSREVKHSKWQYTGTPREQAQLAWIKLIVSLGGSACFAISEGTI